MILDNKRAVSAALAAASLMLPASGCSPAQQQTQSNAGGSPLVAACTISTLCSLVSAVGGPDIQVHTIVPVGASPETYEPTPSDIVTVSHAAIIFENGEGLEAWLQRLINASDAPNVRDVVLADGIPAAARASGNPHLWMDPVYAQTYVREIEAGLAAVDPSRAADFQGNETVELARLAKLDRWIAAQVATIPPDRRVMICFHDAWYYFDKRYGIKNVGAVEPSPGQEPSPEYFAKLIALAQANHVRAVFAEPQFSPKLADALASSAGIQTVEDLYDDTLGTSPGLSDYDGMMRYDVGVIVKAMKS
ncbi:MAG TPA: metal ABC transporter substrate-binding protein [Candidatus Eremiobacteraceae bacterium]|nr:metal ABC transporter substrate-binding protein [Candidatus Eremiobacteraceae bacterium]